MDTLDRLRAGALAGSRRLDLSCGLTALPPEVYDLADTLEILNLSDNRLDHLPDELVRLRNLRVLFCSGNDFTALPPVLGRMPSLTMIGFKANRIDDVPAESLPPGLRWLILTDNRIAELPASIGRCAGLRKVALAGNRLGRLPDAMAACRELELLRISANRFATLPPWLFALPRLAWLAFAGNPCCAVREAAALADSALTDIPWSSLTLERKLGEGASGIIHQGQRRLPSGALEPVAVKLFKGGVTSDGYPHSELAAALAAGAHPNLIPVLGRLAGHPAGTAGLVMPLIDTAFTALAGPPSLESCTRDIYSPSTLFTPGAAVQLLQGAAAAAAHLHAHGMMHGDLYAHNILHDGMGRCLLGDFGAASFIGGIAEQRACERIDARAIGHLVEEVMLQCGTDIAFENNLFDLSFPITIDFDQRLRGQARYVKP